MWQRATRTVAEEVAVAFTYDGATYAVMMATPSNLEDFALGFSLTEGIIASPGEIEEIDIVPGENGIDLRLSLREERRTVLDARRRRLAGPVGCGLCGIESLRQAMRDIPTISAPLRVAPAMIAAAVAALPAVQPLNRATGAVHAAAFWRPEDAAPLLREDVGRHNALDKLAGALARAGQPAGHGIVLLTSRLSVELVQKAAMLGAGIVVAISAPTALALSTAEAAGITLIGIARDDGFEVFTHPARILGDSA
jgi:FdhD protein